MKKRSFDSQTAADNYYMSEALIERLSTDDPKGKIVLQSAVGAVITKNDVEITRSANVLPPAIKVHMQRTGEEVSAEDRYHLIEHAERSAIFKAIRENSDISDATIYCTRFPCSDCARAIVWAGIKRAVFAGGFGGEQRWLASQRAALKILRRGGVTVRYLSCAENAELDS
ncbi:MAG: deaminase [Halobacteriota archaeon]